MPWTQSNNSFSLQGVIYFTMHPYNYEIDHFMISVGRSADIRQIVEKFLKELEDPKLVQIEFEQQEPTEKLYGSKKSYNLFARFEVHKDDIQKVFDKDVPIRIKCTTDVFPNNKDAFIDFFKDFYTYLGW